MPKPCPGKYTRSSLCCIFSVLISGSDESCLLLENQRVELGTLGTLALDLLDQRTEVLDVLGLGVSIQSAV